MKGKGDMHASVTVNGQQPNEGTTDLEHFVIYNCFIVINLHNYANQNFLLRSTRTSLNPLSIDIAQNVIMLQLVLIARVLNSREDTES